MYIPKEFSFVEYIFKNRGWNIKLKLIESTKFGQIFFYSLKRCPKYILYITVMYMFDM